MFLKKTVKLKRFVFQKSERVTQYRVHRTVVFLYIQIVEVTERSVDNKILIIKKSNYIFSIVLVVILTKKRRPHTFLSFHVNIYISPTKWTHVTVE